MAVRGDEVANSIDAQVREAIEKVVGEIRSSIEDVRETVDSQLSAALQSAQADVNSISLLPLIKKAIGDLEGGAPVAPVAPAGMSSGRLKQALQTVERGKSQVDVLNSLLEQALDFGSRAALLILRGETFSGWKGIGFAAHGGNDEMVKRFNAAPGLIPELDQVLRSEHVVLWDGANISSRLGVTPSSKAILVPMVIKDKVAAAVYVDAVEEDIDKLDTAALEILVFATGLLIDTLAIRKKIPSPSLTEGGETGEESTETRVMPTPAPPPPPPPRPAPAPAPRAAQPPPAASRPAPPPMTHAAPPTSTVAISALRLDDAGVATPVAPPPAPHRPARPSVEMPRPGGLGEEGPGRPSTQYIPPSGVSRAAGAAAAPTDESKKHDEARRFARLLVSEIKLYNESKVDQGRKSRDLYERLKEDIDRSRQMYDERIPEDVRKGTNYFYDELVRILADGDAGVLGL